jgi:hypothetical protein
MKNLFLLLVFCCILFTGIGQEYQNYYIRGIHKMEQKKYGEAIEEFSLTLNKKPDF